MRRIPHGLAPARVRLEQVGIGATEVVPYPAQASAGKSGVIQIAGDPATLVISSAAGNLLFRRRQQIRRFRRASQNHKRLKMWVANEDKKNQGHQAPEIIPYTKQAYIVVRTCCDEAATRCGLIVIGSIPPSNS